MGNETSGEYREDGKQKRGVLRSSSLKFNRPTLNNNSLDKSRKTILKDVNCDNKRKDVTSKSIKLKRSKTFTAFSISRIQTTLTKDSSDETINIKNTNLDNKFKEPEVVDYKLKFHSPNETAITDDINGEVTTNTDEKYSRKTVDNNLNSSDKQSHPQKRFSSSIQITTGINKPDKEVLEKSKSKNILVNINRVRSNSFDATTFSHNNIEMADQQYINKTLNDKENIDKRFKTSLEGLHNSSEGTHVSRSQSVKFHHKAPMLILEERPNSADEEMDDTTERVPTTRVRRGNGGRRISDSFLLKEQHVKRSEQFTQMLKQYRAETKHRKLSSYGLGVISEKNNKVDDERPRYKLQRQNDYLNSWLQDKNERINILTEAVKGDPDNVHKLRASFKERSLKTPLKDLLPQRPSSVKLLRRNNSDLGKHVLHSDDSFEDINDPLSNPHEVHEENKPKRNPFKKQLSDTVLLVDNSFKNFRKEAIVFSNHTSTTYNIGANNVAVVKPMQFIKDDTNRADELKTKSRETTITVNTVLRATNYQIPSNSIHIDLKPIHQNDKRKLAKEELNDVCKDINTKRLTDDILQSQNLTYGDPIPVNQPKKMDDQDELSHMETVSGSVNRITKSLSKVMEELKDLRQQDITLAKQLIGLGKSIRQFKHEHNKKVDMYDMMMQQDGDV